MQVHEYAAAITQQVEKIIIGKASELELLLTAVFSGGHVLLEDLPGSGKTTLIKTLSLALGCSQKRIQFTPDLLPSDVIGTRIFDQKQGDFLTRLGPVHTNLLLADEINRAIPRTQSALLEAMEERQITIDGSTYPLPDPFFVMATQNPVEKDSTFPLPAAQMDRFFLRLSLGYPDRDEERRMLDVVGSSIPFEKIQAVASPQILREIRAEIDSIWIHDMVKDYIVDLVQRTRTHKSLLHGASPRASRSLYQGGKALAAIRGRDHVTPQDIIDLAVPVLAHRIQLTAEARYGSKTEGTVLAEILNTLPVPPSRDQYYHE